MNYIAIYERLIQRSINRSIDGYIERHHVVPRCMGGDDSVLNIVRLTPEEHYIAHQLLVKIHPENGKLAFSAYAMTVNTRPRINNGVNNKAYGWIKRRASKARSAKMKGRVSFFLGRKHTQEVKEKLSRDRKELGIVPPSQLGVKMPDSEKKKLSDFWKGKRKPPRTKEHIEKIASKIRGMKHTQETRDKLSALRIGKKFGIVVCPHCGKEGGSSAMGRWHFDNCKLINFQKFIFNAS